MSSVFYRGACWRRLSEACSRSGAGKLDDIEARINNRVLGLTRPAVAETEETFAETDDERAREARQRITDGTILLFDRERILCQSPEGLTNPIPFSKGQRDGRFKLAFVDTPVKTEAEAEKDPWFTYKHPEFKGILVPRYDHVSATMRAHVVAKLGEAIKAKADAIVFPEFGLPPVDLSDIFPNPRDFDPFDLEHQKEVDKRFEQSADAMLKEACQSIGHDPSTPPFIFYGSMHCQRSRYNIGVVSPGSPFEQSYVLAAERGNPITSEVKTKPPKDTPRTGPLVHKKRFPARRAGEAARVPGGLGFRLYPSRIGLIAVIICSDVIDLNQFYYIVSHNQKADPMTHYDRIGLVIVPAYNHSELLLTTCRDLSALAQTTVFVGNAIGQLPTPNKLHTFSMPPSAIFQGGSKQSELEAVGIVETRSRLGVHYYDFDPAPPLR